MAEAFALLLLAAAVAAWIDSLGAREAALEAGREACARYGLQFLDDTVAFAKLRLLRDEEGRMRLVRLYSFEFSEDGANRRSGAIQVHGRDAEDVQLEPYSIPRIRSIRSIH
ncbi:MAG: DUF3301 domain-containing protein [Betaproteobacteria bacterium]|nr:DUF3301 domain-containing protein [Betaproteobacteria bacterium]